jgi:hypothetical protein
MRRKWTAKHNSIAILEGSNEVVTITCEEAGIEPGCGRR